MSYRTGKSYLTPIIRIQVTDPDAHRLRGKINQLRREINQAQQAASRFNEPLPAWVGEKKQTLAGLEQQLKKVEV